jgi:hypothetical protein
VGTNYYLHLGKRVATPAGDATPCGFHPRHAQRHRESRGLFPVSARTPILRHHLDCDHFDCERPTTTVIERFPRDDTPWSFCDEHTEEWNKQNPDAVTWQWDVR